MSEWKAPTGMLKAYVDHGLLSEAHLKLLALGYHHPQVKEQPLAKARLNEVVKTLQKAADAGLVYGIKSASLLQAINAQLNPFKGHKVPKKLDPHLKKYYEQNKESDEALCMTGKLLKK
jgi:hypothetical protein